MSQPVHLNDGSKIPLGPLPSADVGGSADGTAVCFADQQQGLLLDSAPCSPSLDLCDSKLRLVGQRPGAYAHKPESIYGSHTGSHRMFSSLEELAELISEIGPYVSGLSRRFHLAYTRYADDITFSSNHNVYQPDGVFMQELHRIIDECHFTINPKKTRLQKRGTRQEVTGLTVCSKPNVSRKYIKSLRAQIHKIKHTEAPTVHEINVARGKLNYLRMVKGATDPTYLAYLKHLNIAVKGKHFG